MAATTEPSGSGPHEPGTGSVPSSAPTEPAASLIGTLSSYQCSNCGAELAVDQHYCVECGTRRGNPRFKLAAPAVAEQALVVGTQVGGLPSRAAGASGRLLALLAAIVVLLAVGVGVLIGESGNTVKVTSVTVAAGSGATGSGATGSGATGSGATGSGATGSSSTSGGTPTKSSSGSSKKSGSGSGTGYSFGN